VLTCARAISAELLLVGTHDRVGLEKLLLGSTAAKVAKSAHCRRIALREVPRHGGGAPAPCNVNVKIEIALRLGDEVCGAQAHARRPVDAAPAERVHEVQLRAVPRDPRRQ
jgi:Universal stress protein family